MNNMKKRSAYRNGLILSLDKKWTTESKLEVELKSVNDLSAMDYHNNGNSGLVECRGKLNSANTWTMHDFGSKPSFCQWRLTEAGLVEKKKLQDQGWYLAWE